MAAPDNKETLDPQAAKPLSLPRADQAAIMSSDGAVQLPARPIEAGSASRRQENTESRPVESYSRSSGGAAGREALAAEAPREKQRGLSKDDILKHRILDLEVLVAQSEQQRKAFLTALFAGVDPEKGTVAFADTLLRLSANSAILEQVVGGSLSQEALARHLLGCIHQQRGSNCSAKELAMLDSLEFQLMRVLQHINPSIRIQQQQQIQDDGGADDAGSSGPEKVEEERESGMDGIEEADTDTDTSYSPRSKKGKARARDRKSRFKKWLAMMMRVFRGQGLVMRGPVRRSTAAKAELKERMLIKPVRIFGKVIDSETNIGVEGVKIVSNTLGSVLSGVDGSYSFENVTIGTSYSLAPLKSGCLFSPRSVNEVALDYREHNFLLVRE